LQNYNLKISANSPANIASLKSKSKISFGYGWTPEVSKAIKCCDVAQITKELAKRGIEANFDRNNIVAWLSYQGVKIFEHLNNNYGLNLDLPKAIYFKDFSKLGIQEDYAKTNWYPVYLPSDSNRIFPERTILFNSFESKLQTLPESEKWKYKWKNIDPITEELHKNGILGSAHFLHGFLTENSHVANIGHLLKIFEKLSPPELLSRLRSLKSEEYSNQFKLKYSKLLSSISKHATDEPFEAVAEDMSVKIVNSLDPITLLPKYNPLRFSSYQNNPILAILLNLNPKNKILRKVWNGEFLA